MSTSSAAASASARVSAASSKRVAVVGIGVRAADGLLDDLVDDSEREQIGAVSFSASAASTFLAASRHRMAAHPSGGMTL